MGRWLERPRGQAPGLCPRPLVRAAVGGSHVWGSLGQEQAEGTSTWPGPRLLLWQQDRDREAQASFPVLLQNWPKAGQSRTERDRAGQRRKE